MGVKFLKKKRGGHTTVKGQSEQCMGTSWLEAGMREWRKMTEEVGSHQWKLLHPPLHYAQVSTEVPTWWLFSAKKGIFKNTPFE